MTAPVRVQLSRRRGWRMPANTVKVDRTTKFGNPFLVTEDRGPAEVVMAFKTWLAVGTCTAGMPKRKAALICALPELRGKNLGCWCPIGTPCHADVLLRIANA